MVLLQATLVHPDIDTFGTERLFAWKLLSDFVSPDDDGDDVTLARKYIKHVEVGPLAHGTVNKRGRGWFSITRATEDVDDEDAERPAVVYTIEVSDPSLLSQLEEGDSEESLAYVEHDKVILVETSAGPANAPGKAKANKAKASKAKETTTRARARPPGRLGSGRVAA
ncbi:MAG: hypothetical protein IPM54_12085 [Polyangiaceae bacterium]|nr:hypothetical protein [Polyangiaceae bacterium]